MNLYSLVRRYKTKLLTAQVSKNTAIAEDLHSRRLLLIHNFQFTLHQGTSNLITVQFNNPWFKQHFLTSRLIASQLSYGL